MKTEHQVILSTRFIATLCHVVALIIVACTKEANIAVGLSDFPSQSAEDGARADVDAAITIGLFCFAFDIISLFGGFSIFFPKVNVFQILSHFCGGVLLSWFITHEWNYRALWTIVGVCNIPSAAIEVFILLGTYVFNIFTK